MIKNFLNSRGFTLIEILAAITLLAIILLSFASIMVNNFNTSYKNLDKLSTIQLADTYFNRVSNVPLGLNTTSTLNDVKSAIEDSTDLPKTIELNNKTYIIEYKVKHNTSLNIDTQRSESQLGLFTVIVEVSLKDTEIKSSTEGYIQIEKTTP